MAADKLNKSIKSTSQCGLKHKQHAHVFKGIGTYGHRLLTVGMDAYLKRINLNSVIIHTDKLFQKYMRLKIVKLMPLRDALVNT